MLGYGQQAGGTHSTGMHSEKGQWQIYIIKVWTPLPFGQFFIICMQFSANVEQIIGWHPPPLGNPGSAAEDGNKYKLMLVTERSAGVAPEVNVSNPFHADE